MLTIEKLEQSVSSVSIVNFEHVIAGWVAANCSYDHFNSFIVFEACEKKLTRFFYCDFIIQLFFRPMRFNMIKALKQKVLFKLHALRRIRKYLTPDKAKVLCNVFIKSQFSYASIIWMFCRKMDYLKMEKIRYKALRIVFDSNESLEDLFLHSNEVSIHQKQLRQLTSEIYKSLRDLSPEFIKPFFTVKEFPYILRNGDILHFSSARTTYYGNFSGHVKCGIIYRFP